MKRKNETPKTNAGYITRRVALGLRFLNETVSTAEHEF
jgi:hypothetical protein